MTRDEALERTAHALGIDALCDDPAGRVIQFAEHLPAIHGEAAVEGGTINLEQWEIDAIESIYGTLKEDGRRQYRTAYIEIPRKNGKSTFCAILVLYGLLIEQEPNAEIYSVAYTMKQAKIVFDAAANILQRLPEDFVSFERVYANQEKPVVRVVNPPQYGIMHHYPSGGKYEVLAANSASSYGYNPSMVIFDELHVQKSRDLWATMRTSFGARREPLLLAITTAGSDRNTVCYQVREHALKVKEGKTDHPTFLPIIYGADKDDDWRDRETWKKANPALGSLKTWESMEEEFREAVEMPSAQNEFKREHLNIWTQQNTRWIDVDMWLECAGTVDLDYHEAHKTPCYGGLDLSSKSDLTCLAVVFPVGGGVYETAFWFWMPELIAEQRDRNEGGKFMHWAKEGYITLTPGNEIDYDQVRDEIDALGDRFAFHEIGFDPWHAAQLAQQLTGLGFTMVKMRQGHPTMAEPSDLFESKIRSQKIVHPNNPVMNSHVENVEAHIRGGAKRPVKPADETRNIDGVVSEVMALGRAMLHGSETSVYEDREMLVL